MNDMQLRSAIRTALLPRLVARGFTGVAVKAGNQRLQQGAETAPTIYMDRLPSLNVGHPDRSESWDNTLGQMHTEEQIVATTFQFMSLVTQDQTNTSSYSAGDLARAASQIMQSDAVLAQLRQAGIATERVTEIRNPYYTDDRNQFAETPSFDVTFTYTESHTESIEVLQSAESGVYRV